MVDTPLPKTSQPATNALNLVGIAHLEDLTRFTEAEVAALHGVGPKAIRIWKEAMAERGLAFAQVVVGKPTRPAE